MVKTIKNLLLQNEKTDDLETWYVALSMRGLPRLYEHCLQNFKVKTCFSQKQLGNLEFKFIGKLKGERGLKFIQMSWVT